MLIVAGIRLTRDEALALASMLSRDGFDRLGRVLIAAVTKGQAFVALERDDREDMLAVLTRRTTELVDLRHALFDELNWQREGLSPPSSPRGLEAATTRRSRSRGNVAWV